MSTRIRIGATAALSAAAVAAALTVAPSPAEARDPGCGVRVVCLWEHNNYRGRVLRIFEGELRANRPRGVEVYGALKGRVSSIVNTTSLDIAGLAGNSSAVPVARYRRKPQLTPNLNDKVARIVVVR